ncbi:MAG TPA: PDZ domain-containing protein [Pyrinomonadaceae bacterium]|nr:PDZ domain-containing protein [Pyrinomonadaceae bacterium]
MFQRSIFAFVAMMSLGLVVVAQEAAKPAEKAPRAFTFAFGGGDGGYLGVQTVEVNKENCTKFGLTSGRGVAIEKVVEGSPAANAGLRDNDVIIAVNGDEVASSRKLTRLITEIDPDHTAKITVLRNGSQQDVTATLGRRPTPKFENGSFSGTIPAMPSMPQFKEFPRIEAPGIAVAPGMEGKSFAWNVGQGRSIGIAVYPITKQLGERFGVESGLMINNVRDNSPAAKAGLRAGDIIFETDGKAVKNNLDLIRAINAKKEGDVQITYIRDRDRKTVTITPEISKDGGFVFSTDGDGVFPAPKPGAATLVRPAVPMTPRTPMPSPAVMPAFPGRIL